jgi:hypothetical protein
MDATTRCPMDRKYGDIVCRISAHPTATKYDADAVAAERFCTVSQ